VIPRRLWLALLCLSPLAFSNVSARAEQPWEPTDELFALWRSFPNSTPSSVPTFSLEAVPRSPWLYPEPGGEARQVVPLAPASYFSPSASGIGSDDPMANLWERSDNKPRKVSQKSEGLLGSLSAQVEVTDAPGTRVWDDPSWKRAWQTNESWQLGVAGPVSVFGQLGANSDEAGQADMKVTGRAGLTCKLPVGSLAEFTFRGGPGVSYTDPLHPLRTQGRSDWLLEVQARWPLLFGIGLEYQGTALPSLSPLQQDTINQDVRLAFPVGSAGKLKVGAKQQWTGMLDQRGVWTDNTQLYLGLELSR
jgi:hypothetical protein